MNKKFDKKSTNNNKGGKKKPAFTKMTFRLGSSDFYNQSLSDIVDLFSKIPFDIVAIPVSMSRALLNGDDSKGFMNVGTVYSTDGTDVTVTISDTFKDKITDDMVVTVRCRKDRETDEITYISAFNIEKGEPADLSCEDFEVSDSDTPTANPAS